MKKVFFLFLSLIITIGFVSCGSDSDTPTPPKEKTLEDVERAFSELDIKPGINDFELEALNENRWFFRVIAPDNSDTTPKPLFVDLHGASGGNPDAHKFTSCYIEPGLSSLNTYVIVPNGGTRLWHHPANQQLVLALTNWALKYWNVDPAKVVVTGYSNGGNGSWFFAETQSSLFSAAIPMASSYNTLDTSGNARKIDTPLYVIHGENDELFPLADTEAWVQATADVGTDVQLVVASGLTHTEPCSYVDYFKDAVTWVQTVW